VQQRDNRRRWALSFAIRLQSRQTPLPDSMTPLDQPQGYDMCCPNHCRSMPMRLEMQTHHSHTPLALRSRNDHLSSDVIMIWGVTDSQECPRCGSLLPPVDGPRRGRRRVWCSHYCRRAAHAERAAAELGRQPVRVVEVPRIAPVYIKPVSAPRDVTSTEAAERVLGDAHALMQVLRGLTARAHAEGFGADLYDDALDFAQAVQSQAATVGDDAYVIE
jgi:hypothetical protein